MSVVPIKPDLVKAALKKAREEVTEEKQKAMIQQFKSKLKAVESAESILKNLKRELDEMEHELNEL